MRKEGVQRKRTKQLEERGEQNGEGGDFIKGKQQGVSGGEVKIIARATGKRQTNREGTKKAKDR